MIFGTNKLHNNYCTTAMWQCDCDSNHFIALKYWIEDDGSVEEGYFSVVEEGKPGKGVFGRLAAAWDMLRGKDHVWSEVILDSDVIREMIDALAELNSKIA